MNEKMLFIFECAFIFICAACSSTGIPHHGIGAARVRENISTLAQEQSKERETNTRIEYTLKEAARTTAELNLSIRTERENIERFAAILRKIRERAQYSVSKKTEKN